MIFFINNSGTIVKDFPAQVYQGSDNANNIYLVAPFARNLTATAAFILPNGIITEPYSLSYTGEITGFADDKGNTYRGWSMDIPNDITEQYGVVVAQFTFYAAGRIFCTSSTSFTVGRGVPVIPPQTPTEDVYRQILQLIATLQQDLGNGYYAARAVYAWNSTYSYGASELVYYPMGQYGVYVKSIVNNNTQPPYTNGVIGSQWRLVIDFNIIMNALGDVAESVEAARKSAEAAAGSASSAAVSASNAAQSSASALNYANSARGSANSASASAAEAAGSATEVKESLKNYYTKIEIDSGVAKTLDVTMDSSTYVMSFTLRAADGTALSSHSIDLPLESVIVDGRYDEATKSIVLTLQNGQTITVPIGDLISGLASQEDLDKVIDGRTPVAKAIRSNTAGNADNAEKVTNTLTVIVDGEPKTYNGSAEQTLTINTTANTDPEAVHYTPQSLTPEQQSQARANVNAQVVGDYAVTDGTYPNMRVGRATADGNGNNIEENYLRSKTSNFYYNRDQTYSWAKVATISNPREWLGASVSYLVYSDGYNGVNTIGILSLSLAVGAGGIFSAQPKLAWQLLNDTGLKDIVTARVTDRSFSLYVNNTLWDSAIYFTELQNVNNYLSLQPSIKTNLDTSLGGDIGAVVIATNANNYVKKTGDEMNGALAAPTITIADALILSADTHARLIIGDDCWIQDADAANCIGVRGQQNNKYAGIVFGTDNYLFGHIDDGYGFAVGGSMNTSGDLFERGVRVLTKNSVYSTTRSVNYRSSTDASWNGSYGTAQAVSAHGCKVDGIEIWGIEIPDTLSKAHWIKFEMGKKIRCAVATPLKQSTDGYSPGLILWWSENDVYIGLDENLWAGIDVMIICES